MATSPNFTARPPSNPPLLNPDQVEDLLKLQKAAQKISSILDLDQLVDKVVNEVARSFGCLDSDIYLHNQERGELSLVCAHGCAGCDLHGPGHSDTGRGRTGEDPITVGAAIAGTAHKRNAEGDRYRDETSLHYYSAPK